MPHDPTTHVRPADAKRYFEGPIWEAERVPEKLLGRHRLKPGTWGELVVLDGRVRLHYDAPPIETMTLEAGEVASIPPEIEHHLELLGPVRLRVDFYRVGS